MISPLDRSYFYCHNDSDYYEESDAQTGICSSKERNDCSPSTAEEAFRKKYNFRFDEFSFNPFEKPSIHPSADSSLLGEKYKERTLMLGSGDAIWYVGY